MFCHGESSWCDYLKLTITLDGVTPTVERTIIVSSISVSVAIQLHNPPKEPLTNKSQKELHHQILCPAIGWTSNYHAYAIRRRLQDHMGEEECWVRPPKSTAFDVIFQPLYIGGAVADDRSILLGDLVFTEVDKGLDFHLQYVYDFGCWWSHTIRAEPCEAPQNGCAAVLVSGSGYCPPEDTGGITKFCPLVAKLKGVSVTGEDSILTCGPSSPNWWSLFYDDFRGKTNTCGINNPSHFNLKRHQEALKGSLQLKQITPGTEHRSFIQQNTTGLGSTQNGPGAAKPKVKKEVKKAKDKCAVCNVTVGLRLCSSCKSIAFCCREHQLEFWPQHKAECKAIRKQMGA